VDVAEEEPSRREEHWRRLHRAWFSCYLGVGAL
jgi:hypothetical protein